MFHISDFKRFLSCHRYYYLYQEKKVDRVPYIYNEDNVTSLCIKKLRIDNYYLGMKNDPASRFIENFKSYEWFVKARLEADGLRVKVPIIHKTKDGIDIYFTYYGLCPKENELDYYRFTVEVIRRNNINVNSIYIIYLNEEYVLQGDLDVDLLFKISDCLYSDKMKPSYHLNNILKYRINLKNIAKDINEHTLNDYLPIKEKKCHTKRMCPYYYECFKEEKDIPDDSVLTLIGYQDGQRLYENGIHCLKDIEELNGCSKIQYAQIMASRKNGIFFDLFPLKSFLKKIESKPITFIDFEWDRHLIPPYEGLSPCQIVCFEFAMYALDKNDKLSHEVYIGNNDCRLEFIKHLISTIPESGPIVAYNAYGAEVMRLKELASQFEEYREELLSIADRFVDLAYPFVNGIVYDIKMKGDLSLKSLVNAISDYSYDNLEIQNGMEAVASFRNLKDDSQEVVKQLEEYCSLDAYGLYLVYKWLLEISNSQNS